MKIAIITRMISTTGCMYLKNNVEGLASALLLERGFMAGVSDIIYTHLWRLQ